MQVATIKERVDEAERDKEKLQTMSFDNEIREKDRDDDDIPPRGS